ncbi:cupin domain-containing protein [Streptomyces asiaticus]|uniref:cupin domain-containing protein n=1 Tax=Streptomyces asiaticus TaxID=114695 RepID=UPI00381E40E3
MSARTHLTAPWGLEFPASGGAGFHVVLQGNCWQDPGSPGPLRPRDGPARRQGARRPAHRRRDRADPHQDGPGLPTSRSASR